MCCSLSATITFVVIAPFASAQAQALRFQTFDTDPGWSFLRNEDGSIGNNYGFRTTNFTQGASPAGEAGGTFARTSMVSYYADADLNGILTLNSFFHASGEVVFASSSNFNNGIAIGHRGTSTGPVGSVFSNFAGFQLAEPQGFPYNRFRATINLADGGQLLGTEVGTVQIGVPYTWNYSYDPGVGNGILTAELFDAGVSIGMSTVTLSSTDLSVGAAFDSFGMGSGGVGEMNATNTAVVYMDNVSYSIVPVPEPAGVVAMVSAGIVICGWVSRRCRVGRIEA